MRQMKFDSTFGSFGWKAPIFHRMSLYATPGVGAPSGAGSGAAPPAAAPSPAAAPPAAAPTTGTGAPSGAPPASPTGTPTGGLPSNAPNLDALRSSHELIGRLGGPEAVQAAAQHAQLITGLRTEASGLATKLGYTPESFAAAFAKDPVDVLSFLRQESANASRPDPNAPPDVNALLDQRLQPLENQIRMQQVEKANNAVDSELNRVFSEHAIFKGAKDIPPDMQTFAMDLAREYLKYDKAGLQKVMTGDMTPVKTAFDTALDRMFKAVNAYTKWQTGRGTTQAADGSQPPNGGQPPTTNKPFSLSDLIDGKEDAFQGLASTRR